MKKKINYDYVYLRTEKSLLFFFITFYHRLIAKKMMIKFCLHSRIFLIFFVPSFTLFIIFCYRVIIYRFVDKIGWALNANI